MCGISGLVSVNKINLEQRISAMNNSISHRGPDSGGIYIDKNIALGHRRLSIIDVRNISNQPMHSENKRYVIVFNGEIYNFKEIKRKLKYNFITLSDTEVILASIQEKGIDWFLNKANGMFSFALYDKKENKVFIVRDRLGIKPLYYYHDNKYFIFSSEIKGILNSGLVKAEFEYNSIDEYLGNRYVREPFTFFKKIYQVKSGTYMIISDELKINEKKYWDLPKYFNEETNYDEEKIAKEFQKQLQNSIKYRLVSDVSLGTYLSGGLDSSLITAITAKLKKDPINTYTIGFQDLNEFEYSQLVAKEYKTVHHQLNLTKKDYLNNWKRLIKYKDSPLGVPNEIPLAVMSSKLKEKITVVLSGEGADELMGGYGRIFRSPYDFSNNSEENNFYNYFIKKYEYVPRILRDNLLNNNIELREYFDNEILSDFNNHSNESNVFRFFHKYHVKGLLQRVDITTMQTSVEARVPFLDHNLIEYSYKKIPYNLKLNWNDELSKIKASQLSSDFYSEKLDSPKYLLKKIGYNFLPSKIIERKKVGFPVPLNDWFGDLEQLAKDLLYDAEWLRNESLSRLIIDSKKQSRSGQILWMFINVQIFKNNYFNKDWRW